ncbi:hypothetical protein [Nonomuraea sp. NPDC003804]|uniref:hypothetical protein n=1 Tax=Nonomuraea sp. NPDC003804 TaxID=3154547 RepID=UPI0033B43304
MIDISYGDTAADIERKLFASWAAKGTQPAAPVPAAPANLEGRIRAAYAKLRNHCEWVSLAAIRAEIADVARADQDAALRRLAGAVDADLIPENNQKALTAEDRAAALRVGDQPKHYLAIGLR